MTIITADEDQQLLLATEAVVIEGAVELDWNLVGLKMARPVTGEAIKQHLCKVREARESAGMNTPAKAEGKSAFGTRRGVTRYPPPGPDTVADPTGKKRSKPGPKPYRSKAKVVEDEEDSDFEEWKEKPLSKGIKHRSLLFAPAVPEKNNTETPSSPSTSPSPDSARAPAPTTAPAVPSLIIKLAALPKRKRAEESGAQELIAPEPAKKKRVRKSKRAAKEAREEAKKPRVRPSNFRREDWEEHVRQRDMTPDLSLASQYGSEFLAGHAVNQNASVRQNIPPPDPSREVFSKSGETIDMIESPMVAERFLRTEANWPGYRDDQIAVAADMQSELPGAEVNAKDIFDNFDMSRSMLHGYYPVLDSLQTFTTLFDPDPILFGSPHAVLEQNLNVNPSDLKVDRDFGPVSGLTDMQPEHVLNAQQPTSEFTRRFSLEDETYQAGGYNPSNTSPLFDRGTYHGHDLSPHTGLQQADSIPNYLQPQQSAPRTHLLADFMLYPENEEPTAPFSTYLAEASDQNQGIDNPMQWLNDDEAYEKMP